MPPKITQKSEKKLRRKVLSINDKLEIVKKMEQGVSRRALISEYNIGSSTLYDIKKSKPKLMEFIASSDVLPSAINHKNMRKPKLENLDKVLHEWFQVRRTEGITVSGPMIIAKAKDFAAQMRLDTSLNFSGGWLSRFKSRHGIRNLDFANKKNSADSKTVKRECSDFEKEIVKKLNLTADQIYNAHETGLLWKCLPKKTLSCFNENSAAAAAVSKDNAERVTVIACANASGHHRLRLFVIGKHHHTQCLKGIHHLPVSYKTQQNALMDKDIFQEWFNCEFVPAVRQNFHDLGKSPTTKCVLLFDNCQTHPHASMLVSDCGNIFACYPPPNLTSVVQPMEEGVFQDLKCKYRTKFIEQLIHSEESIPAFQSKYSFKDAISTLSLAWKEVKGATLLRAWRKLWPNLASPDLLSDRGKEIEGKQSLVEIVQTSNHTHLQNLADEDIEEWLEVDAKSDVSPISIDQEIIDSIVAPNTQQLAVCPEPEGENEPEQKITWHSARACMDTVVKFLLQNPSFSMQEVLQGYKLKNMMLNKNLASVKQADNTEHL